jgi:hypothetical protein
VHAPSPPLPLPPPCPPQSTCRARGPHNVASYGVDPAFKPNTASYQPDLVAPDDAPMLGVYDCGGLAAGPATYGVVEPGTGLTVNERPYCAELFNARCARRGQGVGRAGRGWADLTAE